MRYFIPNIRVPDGGAQSALPANLGRFFGVPSANNGTDKSKFERLGGIPWGLDRGRWPKCRECGKSQSLLAQLHHHEGRLDLGREGRVLFVFQCAHDPGMCSTWEAFSGANACFVIEPELLNRQRTAVPDDAPPLDPEVQIVDWISRDDEIEAEYANAFYTEEAFLNLPEDVVARVTWSSRLGGVPRWMQSPDEAPKPGWRFIAQLDGTYSFLSPPRPCPPWVSPDEERWEGRTHVATGPNFGGGLAYVFVKDGDGCPEACMFWQR